MLIFLILQIYSLPSFKLVFASTIGRSPMLLTHSLEGIKERKEHHSQAFFQTTTPTVVTPDPTIVEIAMHFIDKSPFPYMMVCGLAAD
jgi:hypothetical protein